jgi:ATP-dependent exoDNAse (exonuclease V) beta subunit
MRLSKYLQAEDLESFFETVNAIFATIPYTLKGTPNEAWFHTLFYLMVAASGAYAQSEVLTSRGRIDMVVHFPEKIYVLEFKCSQTAEAGLKQIHEKGYADRYKGLGQKLLLLGIGFDPKNRQANDWKVETLFNRL